MKIISFTMTNNRAETIGRAIESVVPFVDEVLIIDMGVTDNTIEVVRETLAKTRPPNGHTLKLHVVKRTWPDHFGAARTMSLQECNRLAWRWSAGPTWGLMLDSDEWVSGDPAELRRYLDIFSGPMSLVPNGSGDGNRERLFRLPTKIMFEGPTHEAASVVSRAIAPGIKVHAEAPKPEDLFAKRKRDADLLSKEVERHPTSTRYWYYLGDAYQGLYKFPEALEAYARCFELGGWDEEAAWSMYQTALIHERLAEDATGKMDPADPPRTHWLSAAGAAIVGMTRRADFPELAWMAAHASYYAGDYAQAIRWALIAADLGAYRGRTRLGTDRIAFRWPPAHWEAPFNVLRHAYRKVGENKLADEAEIDFQRAATLREKL